MNELTIARQLDKFLSLARGKGYEIRHEDLDGVGSGICVIRGRKCLFLDVTCGPAEQLESIQQNFAEQTTSHSQ